MRQRAKKWASSPGLWPFCDLRAHFLYVEGYGKEGKVHGDLVLAEVPKTTVCHVELHLPEYGFWLDASSSPMPDPFL